MPKTKKPLRKPPLKKTMARVASTQRRLVAPPVKLATKNFKASRKITAMLTFDTAIPAATLKSKTVRVHFIDSDRHIVTTATLREQMRVDVQKK
jgi:hypothetical protein